MRISVGLSCACTCAGDIASDAKINAAATMLLLVVIMRSSFLT
jgi:hypothetical protein